MARKPKPTPTVLRPDDRDTETALELAAIRHVAGLDTASDRFHLFLNDGRTIVGKAKGDPDDRRHQLHTRAQQAFQTLPTGTLLVCEEPLALQNGKTTRLLGLAAGAIWAAHLSCAIFWAWADVSAWKKSVVGNGNASKDMIEAWVRENMGLEFDPSDSDLYDAAAICRYGEQAVGLA